MADPRIQSFASHLDIKNHDYAAQNRLILGADTQQSPPRAPPSPQPMGLPNRVVYKSLRILMVNDASKPKLKDWLSFIPPLPGDDILPENIIAMDRRHTQDKLELPDYYKQPTASGLLPAQQSEKRARKTCAKCNQPITGQFVRALERTFHMDCFRCAECNTPCLNKFFPQEQVFDGVKTLVPLCEYDYFKNLDLICYTCNQALRGLYITAVGHKYHLEHFTCVVCDKVFETDESFYEHDKAVYCHYHYSKLFAKHCESCSTPILKQFIEVFKGGRYQQWHPECFMCYRFWNVLITVDCINPPAKEIESFNVSLDLVLRIWSTLLTYEEEMALCIIAMLEYATHGNHMGGLKMAAQLVLKVEYLFRAFDLISELRVEEVLKKVQDDEEEKNSESQTYTPLKLKYVPLLNKPRSFLAKLMSYLAFIKKHALKDQGDAAVSKRLIAIITGLANYLKLIITCGLTNILEYNKLAHNQAATDRFLGVLSKHTEVGKGDPFRVIAPLVPLNLKDLCFQCGATIEDRCVRFGRANNVRWHVGCLRCANCAKPADDKTIPQFAFSVDRNEVFCAECAAYINDSSCQRGFQAVSKLMQIVYISEIALVRVKYVMEKAGGSMENADVKSTRASQLVTNIKHMKLQRQQLLGHSKSAAGVARRLTIISVPKPNSAGIGDQEGYKKSLQMDDRLEIRDELEDKAALPSVVTNLLRGGRLALDDIHRIVSAEETKQLLPNTFKHAKSLELSKEGKMFDVEKVEKEEKSVKRRKPQGKYFSELSAEEHFIVRHIAIVAFARALPDSGYTVDQLLELIPTRKAQTFWGRIKGSSKKSGSSKGPKVFGAPLEELTERYGTESERAVGPKVVTIPAFVEDCLGALRQKDMSVEGIFRKNGNIRRLRELTEAINESPDKLPDFLGENQIQLLALVKKFLREMPDPLFTFKLYDLWIESQRLEERAKSEHILRLVICMLPKANRDLLEVLFLFFNWVSSFLYIDENTGSKMTTHNLATVLAPNVLYRKEDDAIPAPAAPGGPSTLQVNTEAGDGYLRSIEVLNVLISRHLEFATVPLDVMEVYRTLLREDSSLQGLEKPVTSKELIAKIEALVEHHPGILRADGGVIDEEEEEGVVKGVVVNGGELEGEKGEVGE